MTGISGWMEIIVQAALPAIPIRKITRHIRAITATSIRRPGLRENIVKRGSATMTTASGATGMQAANTMAGKAGKAGIAGKAVMMTIERMRRCVDSDEDSGRLFSSEDRRP
jgi:hypothetical protein